MQSCSFRYPDIRAVGQNNKTTVAFHSKQFSENFSGVFAGIQVHIPKNQLGRLL